jgi:hypothetical protein
MRKSIQGGCSTVSAPRKGVRGRAAANQGEGRSRPTSSFPLPAVPASTRALDPGAPTSRNRSTVAVCFDATQQNEANRQIALRNSQRHPTISADRAPADRRNLFFSPAAAARSAQFPPDASRAERRRLMRRVLPRLPCLHQPTDETGPAVDLAIGTRRSDAPSLLCQLGSAFPRELQPRFVIAIEHRSLSFLARREPLPSASLAGRCEDRDGL